MALARTAPISEGQGGPILRSATAILLTILCMGFAVPASAQANDAAGVSRADLVRLLGRMHQEDAVRADLAALGFAGENLDLATQHAADMLQDPIIAGHIADRVLAVQGGGRVELSKAQGLLWGVIDRGLGHLPLRDLRYYYLVEQAVLGAMPTRTCGRAVRGTLPPARMADVTARTAARLNTEGLRNYYRIQLRAAQLGATRARAQLSPAQAAAAEADIFAALTRRIATEKDAPRIMRSFSDLGRASNRDACSAGRLFIDAVLTLEGDALKNALVQLSLP
jgi:hypothetical protein